MTTDLQLLTEAEALAEEVAHMGVERMNRTVFMATPPTITALQTLQKTAAELVHVLHSNPTQADQLARLRSIEAALETAGTFGIVSDGELDDLLRKVDSIHDRMERNN